VTALAVERLAHDFGGLRALNDLTLAVAEGERRAIIGPNGAGKTTLFNVITGLLRPTAGRIRLRGRDVTALPTFRRARLGLGRTFQITTLFAGLTVLDNVLLAVQGAEGARFALHRPAGATARLIDRAGELLDAWGLGQRAGMPVRQLSYGEQRQLELVLALAGRPRVLLLDEPTAGLSPAETSAVAAMIDRFPRDLTVLLIEHDMDVALELVDRVTVLFQGGLLADGTPAEIRHDGAVAEIYLGADDARR
jgi:branched-chain amino acid transport system ATP-binding protein